MRSRVEVPRGNAGQSLGGDPREHVRPVDQLVAVDQRAQAVGLAREAASRSSRDGILLARMRVGGDRRRACGPCLAERGREPVVERHQPVEADGQRVRRPVGIGVGVGQLDSGDHQQVVGLQRPLGLLQDRLQVGVVGGAVDHRAGRVISADDVVGDNRARRTRPSRTGRPAPSPTTCRRSRSCASAARRAGAEARSLVVSCPHRAPGARAPGWRCGVPAATNR